MAASLHLCRTRLYWKHSSLCFVQQRSCNVNSPLAINHRTLAYSQRCLNEERTSQNHNRPRETTGETQLQKFRSILKTFTSGSHLLVKDVKRMVQIQRKLKENNYDWNILTTEEIFLLNQVSTFIFTNLNRLNHNHNHFIRVSIFKKIFLHFFI